MEMMRAGTGTASVQEGLVASFSPVQQEELFRAIAEVRKATASTDRMVHGWSITWSVREVSGAKVRGDLCVVDPRDHRKYNSVIALRRKLGLVDGEAVESMVPAEAGASDGPAERYSEGPSLRRTIKSTTVMVDGQAVKRANMYDMETGESSVWDRELGAAEEASGSTRTDRAQPVPLPAAKRARQSGPRPPVVLSTEQLHRQQRNEELRGIKAATGAPRSAFFAPHAEALARFGARLPAANGASDGASEEGSGGGATAVVDFETALAANALLEPPPEVRAEMRDYQKHGLRWLAAMHACGVNSILADEMGLGKTLQTIALLAHVKYTLGQPGPHLIIAPLSVLSAWTAEFRRFCPAMRVLKLHSSDGEERARLMSTVEKCDAYDVAITTPEMAKAANVQTKLAHRSWWHYLIVDEGHVLKNDQSQVSQALRKFHCARCVLLTGTPLQNNLHELWALLNFLYPDVFVSSAAFDTAFDLGRGEVDDSQLTAASLLLRPFVLRRTKAEVEKGLPPKLETSIACPLSEMQRFWYKRLLLKESTLLLSHLEGEHADAAAASGTDWKKLSSLLMQLRKCCNHPFLFPGVEPPPGAGALDALIDGSGKFALLDRLLAKLHAAGHRVVLFSQFTSTLDLLETYLSGRGYEYGRLDGSTNRVQRTVDINAFNVVGSSRFVFLMSTRAGGLGINCQTADTCILFDSDWNPQVDMQAMARVHRIGQTKPVHVYRLVTSGTVEERIVQRAEKKLYLDQMVNRDQVANRGVEAAAAAGAAGSAAAAEEELSASDMLSMLKFGAQCCFGADGGTAAPTDEQIDAIIDRSRTATDSVGGVVGGLQHSAANFDATAPMLNLHELQGEAYGQADGSRAAETGDIAAAWAEQYGGKREATSRLTQVHVAGVGTVSVLRENDYDMGEQVLPPHPSAPCTCRRIPRPTLPLPPPLACLFLASSLPSPGRRPSLGGFRLRPPDQADPATVRRCPTRRATGAVCSSAAARAGRSQGATLRTKPPASCAGARRPAPRTRPPHQLALSTGGAVAARAAAAAAARAAARVRRR